MRRSIVQEETAGQRIALAGRRTLSRAMNPARSGAVT